jgi:hypothetical protein
MIGYNITIELPNRLLTNNVTHSLVSCRLLFSEYLLYLLVLLHKSSPKSGTSTRTTMFPLATETDDIEHFFKV